MKILTKSSSLSSSVNTELVVVALTKKSISSTKQKDKSKALSQLFSKCSLNLKELIKVEKFTASPGSSLSCWVGGSPKAVLLVGWDDSVDSDLELGEQYRKLGNLIFQTANKWGLQRVVIAEENLNFHETGGVPAVIEGVELSRYSFQMYKSKKAKPEKSASSLTLLTRKKVTTKSVQQALASCTGTNLARDLVNMPACDCTPRYLVSQARKMARETGLQCRVYQGAQLKKLGAGLLLSVAAGSKEPAALIRLTYKPRKKAKKVISIVGKGVTFDTGGYSIKSSAGMETMKCDMGGAAAVLGAMRAIAVVKPDVEVRCYVPTAENMIDGNATRPGDVVKGLSGKTVEIFNTDAEGRLILADALALAVKEKCDQIVNLATLTGACMVALGPKYAGLFANNDKLADSLIDAGASSGERLWRLPLAMEYRKDINGKIADIKNMGQRYAGAITAALFLHEFVGDVPWAHIDIAGPAFASAKDGYNPAGGIGFGVRTLVDFVSRH